MIATLLFILLSFTKQSNNYFNKNNRVLFSFFRLIYANQNTDFYYINYTMKILSIITLLIFLTSCAGGNVAKVKFGKRCTVADENGLKESSYVLVISKDALKSFDKRINKSNCS